MAVKTADLRHEGDLRFVARTGSGFEIVMDDATGNTGTRPIELLAVAIAGLRPGAGSRDERGRGRRARPETLSSTAMHRAVLA